MTAIRWTEHAVNDRQAIRQYIERDSPRYGRLVAVRFFEATSRLEDFPRSGDAMMKMKKIDITTIEVAHRG